ncbi:MAG: hypothetical protein ACI835_004266 [Planctomycetota bacterium]|jgi:hypothetical protein
MIQISVINALLLVPFFSAGTGAQKITARGLPAVGSAAVRVCSAEQALPLATEAGALEERESSRTSPDEEERDKDKNGSDSAVTAIPRAFDLSEAEPIASLAGAQAMERGLLFLSTQLATSKDGSLPCTSGAFYAPVGVTALGALAFMAAGNTPGRGPHAKSLERTISYLLARVTPDSEAGLGYVQDEADGHSRMHGHGLATLALAQAYGISPNSGRGARIAEALVAATACIERAQSFEGGWYYDPRPGNEHEGSITVCVLQALRAASEAGISVDPKVITLAIEYLKRLQVEAGGFQYALNQPQTTVALTAACLSSLQAAGIYDSNAVHDGYGYIWRELVLRQEARARGLMAQEPRFPFYERFYLSQALWQHPKESEFRRWAPEEIRRVITSQEEDGSWRDVRHEEKSKRSQGRYGRSYATAMNCLFLALPEGILPIFQR